MQLKILTTSGGWIWEGLFLVSANLVVCVFVGVVCLFV